MSDFNLTPDSEILELVERARANRVVLSVFRHSPSKFELTWFYRDVSLPRGTGGQYLMELCEICDQRGVAIDLGVDPGKPWMLDYYANFGFERMAPPRSGRLANKDESQLIPMRRQACRPEMRVEMGGRMASFSP